jgi:transposase-like protein
MPRSAQPFVATLVRTIFTQPSAEEVQAQPRRVTLQLEDRFRDVARMLDEAVPHITAFSSFPVERWRQIWSNNPQERLNREIRPPEPPHEERRPSTCTGGNDGNRRNMVASPPG